VTFTFTLSVDCETESECDLALLELFELVPVESVLLRGEYLVHQIQYIYEDFNQ